MLEAKKRLLGENVSPNVGHDNRQATATPITYLTQIILRCQVFFLNLQNSYLPALCFFVNSNIITDVPFPLFPSMGRVFKFRRRDFHEYQNVIVNFDTKLCISIFFIPKW